MPSGLGKKSILAVHTNKENHEIAKNAGADLVITAPDLENVFFLILLNIFIYFRLKMEL